MTPQQRYPIYKGLQKPLVYRGFIGKFIYWGVGSLAGGLLMGGLLGAITSMYIGGAALVITVSAGLGYTYRCQSGGLHKKTRHRGIFIRQAQLKINCKPGTDRKKITS